jgi:raffinose/stachyose/melibiose transport system substrate-binding protein
MIRIIEKRRKVMKKALQVILTLSLVCFMLASMAETTVTMLTYRSGEDVGAVFFLPQIERFNAKFAGKYKIVVEESPSNTHTDRIKQLALQNKLPFAFQVSDSKWVEDYLIANGKLQDLSAFINERPEMKSRFISESMNFCTKDGKVIALPITVLKPTGLYYNTALFSPGKDITELSWEEFSKALGLPRAAGQ